MDKKTLGGDASEKGARRNALQPFELDPDLPGFLERSTALLAQATAKDLQPLRDALSEVLDATDEELPTRLEDLRKRLPEIANTVIWANASTDALYEALSAAFASAIAPEQDTPTPTNMDYKTQLLTLLGLPQEATDDQIAQAVTACADKIAAGAEAQQLKGDLAESDLDGLGIDNPDDRKAAKELLMSNRRGALALLKNRRALPSGRPPLTNREHAKAPGNAPGVSTPAPLLNRHQRQNKAVAAVRAANPRLSYEAAFHAAQAAEPELFAHGTDGQ